MCVYMGRVEGKSVCVYMGGVEGMSVCVYVGGVRVGGFHGCIGLFFLCVCVSIFMYIVFFYGVSSGGNLEIRLVF